MCKDLLKFIWLGMFFVLNGPVYSNPPNLDQKVNQLLSQYLKDHHDDELLTGVTASIGLPDQEIKSYASGTVSKNANADSMLTDDLLQIGSLTKAYTAAIILQLESEGKLDINQKMGKWLPQYTKWKDVTIKQLLNMTSGIPGYVTVPKLEAEVTKDIKRQWRNKEIVDVVYDYPQKTTGYNYSDTNYIILSMIVEKAAKDTFTGQINSRLISKYNLNHTLYFVEPYPKSLLDVLPRGYYYGKQTGAIKHGEDVTDGNMSLAGAAGAILATSEDIVQWARLIFSGKVLKPKQQKEFTEIVSMKTGKSIKTTTKDDPYAFGLGIMQAYDPAIGKYWLYAGDTIGYRAIYLLNPCNNIIISIAFNSSPFVDVTAKEHSMELMKALYAAVVASDKKFSCKI